MVVNFATPSIVTIVHWLRMRNLEEMQFHFMPIRGRDQLTFCYQGPNFKSDGQLTGRFYSIVSGIFLPRLLEPLEVIDPLQIANQQRKKLRHHSHANGTDCLPFQHFSAAAPKGCKFSEKPPRPSRLSLCRPTGPRFHDPSRSIALTGFPLRQQKKRYLR